MSEQSKIRLVRCPKCENLLQELTDYSVYQCGGCGTVLRAKSKNVEASEKSDEQKVEEISDKFPEKMEDMYITESNVEKSLVVEDDHKLFDDIPEPDHAQVAEEFDDSKPSNSTANASRDQIFRRILDPQMRESRSISGGFRSSTSKFREESSSSSYQMKRRIEPNGFNKIEHLEQDRAELLRKLDELKEQINRTCDVADNPNEKILLERRAMHQDPYNMVEPQYGSYPYRNENFYPSLHSSNQINGTRIPFRSQMLSRVQNQEPSRFQNYPNHSYFPHQDIHNLYQFDPYIPNSQNFHQPSCTCFHCYQNNRIPNNPMFYHQNKPRFADVPPMNPKPGGGFVRHQSHKVVLVPNRRKCYPVSGGAPFLTCFNCSELLQFPKNLNQKKIICGGCSTAIFIKFSDNKLIVSGQSKTHTNTDDVITGGNPYTNGHVNWASTDFSSDEYDFQSTDRKVLFSDPTKSLADMTSLHSTSSCTTEEENNSSSGNLIDRRKQSKSAELPMKVNQSSPPEGSPLQDHFDYSNTKYNNLIQRLGKGNRSGRSEIPKKVTSRQNSMKDVALATEIDIPSNEYGNTGISQESATGNKEESQTKVNKSESFFTGIIKKSFKYSNQSNGQEKANVIVNGQPIRDRLVKKAEKLAGSIQPGEYWYDFRAGFWGVIGGPCQGIIPPLIEEFNYPMPEKCAGGNTGVFVNGRELNKKDLDLLASRGLPTESDRSYILEISGRILDEDSGEELDCLGRLAPTVEKVKHGFGMKPPRTVS